MPTIGQYLDNGARPQTKMVQGNDYLGQWGDVELLLVSNALVGAFDAYRTTGQGEAKASMAWWRPPIGWGSEAGRTADRPLNRGPFIPGPVLPRRAIAQLTRIDAGTGPTCLF
jgi:hypothetical protein